MPDSLPSSGSPAEPLPLSAAEPPPHPRTSMVPWVVATGMFINQMDSTILTTSLPQIAESLGEPPLKLSLAITSYLITLAVFIPISGWIADRFGPRRVFCWAIAIFTLSSAACGFADSLGMLVFNRVIQGFGGALMTPVGRIILGRSFPKDQLYAALAFVSIPALIGPTIGPVVGGLITTYLSWHWVFFVNIPFGVVGIALALKYVKNFDTPKPPPFDIKGFVMVGSGVALLELAIDFLGHRVIPMPFVAAMFIGAAVLLGVYAAYALRRENPVLDLTLFRLRTFRASTLSGSLCRFSIGAVPFLLPLMLQVGFGLSALASGLLTFVMNIGAISVKFVAKPLAARFGFRNLVLYNASVLGLFTMGMALFQPDTPHWIIFFYLMFYGVSRAVQFTNVNALSFADLTPQNLSRGTSMASVIQQVSSSFGVALAATIISLVAGGSDVLTSEDFHWAFVIVALFPILSVIGFAQLRPTDGAEMTGRRGRG
ncbi:MAG TPA: MDR family MFS transporter [Alphaproteobacteria bacterium]|nr:MDR family MFS transporter [Alphaproteobacteria bacterium]